MVAAPGSGESRSDLTRYPDRLALRANPNRGDLGASHHSARITGPDDLLRENHARAPKRMRPRADEKLVLASCLRYVIDLDPNHEDRPLPLLEDLPRESGFLESLEPRLFQVVEENGVVHVAEGIQLRRAHADVRFRDRNALRWRGHAVKIARASLSANRHRGNLPAVSITRPNPRQPKAESSARGPLQVGLALVLLTVCGPSGHAQDVVEPQASGLLILAASSLADVLPEFASGWAARGKGELRFSFDATSRLAPQAVSGARAAVFVAADEEWMRWLEDRGAVTAGSGRLVAGNELVVVVPRGSTRPSGPADLPRLERLGLGGENVPAGRYARAALSSAGVWGLLEGRIVSGGSVRGVLEWVARGEVPAGVVYRSDAIAEPAVEVAFAFDPATHEPIGYWAAPLATARDPASAREFVDFLAGATGRDIFAANGFASPPVSFAVERSLAGPATVGSLPSIGSAIRLSLLVAFLATLAGLVPAVGLGWVLARHDFRGKAILSTAVLAPLVIPPVVTGFLLLSVLGSQSPLGRLLASLGLPVPFTMLGATVAALIVGLPLYVISVRGAFEAVDPLYEELSWTLGVPPRKTFLRVSLPLALPGIVAGAVLAFARALGEFGATVVLAGNVEGSTRTIALAVYTLLESPSGREATWTLVGASVALSLLALLGFETLSRRQRRRLEDVHVR